MVLYLVIGWFVVLPLLVIVGLLVVSNMVNRRVPHNEIHDASTRDISFTSARAREFVGAAVNRPVSQAEASTRLDVASPSATVRVG